MPESKDRSLLEKALAVDPMEITRMIVGGLTGSSAGSATKKLGKKKAGAQKSKNAKARGQGRAKRYKRTPIKRPTSPRGTTQKPNYDPGNG